METPLEWVSARCCNCKAPGPSCEWLDCPTIDGGTVRLRHHVEAWASDFICLCPVIKVPA